jgi:hypothetical protein
MSGEQWLHEIDIQQIIMHGDEVETLLEIDLIHD